ncbi:MAG: helix-turn-helix transcriptional regulator [Sporichthyaceae bacterium]|nr:helix-turn-helix transcriptional regulator [Sporichthyaceae bacterium]
MDDIATLDETVGARIRDLRIRQGLPQGHLSTVMRVSYDFGWHQSTLTRVEAGERPLRLSEAVAVAEILGTDVADLLGAPSATMAVRLRRARMRELSTLREHIEARLEEISEES